MAVGGLPDAVPPARLSPGPEGVPGSSTKSGTSLLLRALVLRVGLLEVLALGCLSCLTHSGMSLANLLKHSSNKPVSAQRARGTDCIEPSASRMWQVHAFMSLIRPNVLCAKRLRRRGLRAEVSISWLSSTPPRVVLPFSTLKGNLRFPRVFEVDPNPAKDLVLASTQGKLRPRALSLLSASLPQATLWHVELYTLHLVHPTRALHPGATYLLRVDCLS